MKEKFWEESKQLWKIAFPAIVSRVALFGIYVVTQAFIGHIGKLELAAYAIVQIMAIRFAHGILVRILFLYFHYIMILVLIPMKHLARHD